MTPAPNTPLRAGDVELLREGDWLLDSAKRVCRFDHLMTPEYIWAHIGKGSSTGGPPSSFAYLGRPDQEGWIAHQGGENPAPGLVVEPKFRIGGAMSADFADHLRWTHEGLNDDITHWRPHVPSQDPAAPSPAPSLGVDLGELRRLAEAATQGPWDHDGGTGWMAPVLRQWTESGCCGQVLETGECCGLSVSQDQEAWDVEQIGSASPQDAVYIAAANPAVILSLISHIEKLEGRG